MQEFSKKYFSLRPLWKREKELQRMLSISRRQGEHLHDPLDSEKNYDPLI